MSDKNLVKIVTQALVTDFPLLCARIQGGENHTLEPTPVIRYFMKKEKDLPDDRPPPEGVVVFRKPDYRFRSREDEIARSQNVRNEFRRLMKGNRPSKYSVIQLKFLGHHRRAGLAFQTCDFNLNLSTSVASYQTTFHERGTNEEECLTIGEIFEEHGWEVKDSTDHILIGGNGAQYKPRRTAALAARTGTKLR